MNFFKLFCLFEWKIIKLFGLKKFKYFGKKSVIKYGIFSGEKNIYIGEDVYIGDAAKFHGEG
ncbi:MAG: hypothetical protein QM490_03605, partial [Candidatus Gracilibacteria bacterium]